MSAIVPAYNEAGRIGPVLEVLTSYPGFAEVIVIDDGSTDATEREAKQFPVRYLKNDHNRGKGYSMDRAVQAASSDIIFFCDADVKGLRHAVLEEIIGPVMRGEVDMFIGMRNRKIYYLSIVLSVVPLLGGERALTKALWQKVPGRYKDRFKIEAALNFYATHHGGGFGYKVFTGLSQTVKEHKYGYVRGFIWRIAMLAEVIQTQLVLNKSRLKINAGSRAADETP